MAIITSKANGRIRLIRMLQEQRKIREREKLFVVEGTRLVEEAAAMGARARTILHDGRLGSRERSAVNRLASGGGEVLEAVPDVLRACSDTSTPPGLLAVLEWPDLPFPEPLDWAVVADGISNPGNLGSLMRTADAFGVPALILAPGTVDPFNPKVVRGAMGAHLRLRARSLARGSVRIPMRGKVESLNAAVAGGILLYEISRQRGSVAGR
jgi:TrmH family RNA methyltransferase